MNTHQWYMMGLRSIQPPNTFIGGVSATISTPALLATKLAIDVSRITNFSVVGSDIQCRITGSYAIPSSAFQADTNITYYKDVDALVTYLDSAFYLTTKLTGDCVFNGVTSLNSNAFRPTLAKRYILPNCTSIVNDNFHLCTNAEIVYIPLAITLGTPSGNNGNFYGIKSGCKIYCHPSLATNNGGAPDADITAAIGFGAVIRYVTNTTAPNPITDLSIGTAYATALQLNFTPPTGSTNAIDFYDCYANGEYKNTITGSGQYIVGLNASTSYTITVKPVDILYNQSTSNAVVQSTNTTSAVPTSGLVSYYKLDEISGTVANDSYGTQHLTNTGVSINQSGKVGTAYKTTGASQKLQTSTATPITGNFTLNMWVYVTAVQSSYSTPFEIGNYGSNTGFGFLFINNTNVSWRINQNYDHFNQTITYGEWNMITMVYNGTTVKFYVNGVLKTTIAHTANPTTTQLRTAFYRQDQGQTAICSIDEVSIYNTAKTQTEIDLLYNLGNGITL